MSSFQPDKQLLSRLKAGNFVAVEAWFRQYHGKLFRLISHKIASKQDAEELVQDIFMSCLKHLPLFRGESSIWTWMQRIARHEMADYYRKRYAKKILQFLPLSELLEKGALHDAHEISKKVHHVLELMSKEDREILLMKYVDKKKVTQIARELGKTAKAVESILFRARNEFRTLYTEEEA
jgi:RNA polymerase sigma-70 factor, ECF subfamily